MTTYSTKRDCRLWFIVNNIVIMCFCLLFGWQFRLLQKDVEQLRHAAISLNKTINDLEKNFCVVEQELIEHYREHNKEN